MNIGNQKQGSPYDNGGIPYDGQKFPHDNGGIPYDFHQVKGQTGEESIEVRILRLCSDARHIQEIVECLQIKDRKTVRKYLKPLLELGRITMTIPDKPKSKYQKYIAIK